MYWLHFCCSHAGRLPQVTFKLVNPNQVAATHDLAESDAKQRIQQHCSAMAIALGPGLCVVTAIALLLPRSVV